MKDSEQALLSIIAQDPEWTRKHARQLSTVLFDFEPHRHIYEAIIECGHEWDMATVTAALRRNNRLDMVGGAHAISEFFMAFPIMSLASYHLQVVQEAAALRRSLRAHRDAEEKLKAALTHGTANAEALLASIREDVDAAASLPWKRQDTERAALHAVLDARRIRVEERPENPVAVVRLCGQTICTPGNISALSAQAKAGKSAALGGLLAAMFTDRGEEDSPWEGAESLGFECAPAGEKAVVWFDTEQSPHDSWKNLERAAKRAGLDAFPDSMRAYRLLDVATPQRRLLLNAETERAAAECGGVHAVILDGVGDLCLSVNDEAEAVGLVDELARLAVALKCVVLVVIHENPGSRNEGKTRGHLGSQLERKAESNLRLVKGSDGVTEIYSERCRSANIPQGRGACFEWSDESGMHVRVERVKVDKAETKRAEAVEEAKETFMGVVGAIRFVDLKARIAETLGVSPATAERRIKNWKKMDAIKDCGEGYIRA